MELKACERCQGKVRFNEERNVYICQYCRTEFKPTPVAPESANDSERKIVIDLDHITGQFEGEVATKVKKGVGCFLTLFVVLFIGISIFLVMHFDLLSFGSGTNFTGNHMEITHQHLTFDIPDAASPRPLSGGTTGVYFDEIGGDIWFLVHGRTGENMTESELATFKNDWFADQTANNPVIPVGTAQSLVLDDATVLVQETRSRAGGQHTLAFVYINSHIYVFQFHAIDRFFDDYRPYFIEVIQSIRWTGGEVSSTAVSDSGVNFTDTRIQIPHRNLVLAIPDTIVPRPVGEANHVGLPFDENENVWVMLLTPSQGHTRDDLEGFKNDWFVNHATIMPVTVAETIEINGQTAYIQEGRTEVGQHTLVFLYVEGEIYVFQYHAANRFFDTYRPYFIEMVKSISW